MITSRSRSAAIDGFALRRTTYSKSGSAGKPCAAPSDRSRGLKPLCAKIDIASPASTAVIMPESPVDCSATVQRRPTLCSRSCANCRQAQGAGYRAVSIELHAPQRGPDAAFPIQHSGVFVWAGAVALGAVSIVNLAVYDCDVEQAASIQGGNVGPDAQLDFKFYGRIAGVKLGKQRCQRSRIEIFRRAESDLPLRFGMSKPGFDLFLKR